MDCSMNSAIEPSSFLNNLAVSLCFALDAATLDLLIHFELITSFLKKVINSFRP